MTAWDVVFISVVQGLTEFLPVSSSGHMTLLSKYLGVAVEASVSLQVVGHLGTLSSLIALVVLQFAKMHRQGVTFRPASPFLRKEALQFLLLVFCGTLPLVMATLLLKDQIEFLFSGKNVGWAFVFTSLLLFMAALKKSAWGEISLKDHPYKALRCLLSLSYIQAFCVGLAQCFAIIPGVSRSGCTVVSALFLGANRSVAVLFSIVLGVPAIIGAYVWSIVSEFSVNTSYMAAVDGAPMAFYLLLSWGISTLFGLLGLLLMLKVAQLGRWEWFGGYLLLTGLYLLSF